VELARILSAKYKRSVRVVELEAIDDVGSLKPDMRQLYFIAKFVEEYLYYYNDNLCDFIIYTSHPIMTLPYTEWFCNHNLPLTVHSVIALEVPKPDLLVHLEVKPYDIEVIRERIKNRNRPIANEELDNKYIEFIAQASEKYVYVYKRKHDATVLEIPARLEVDERVKHIIRYLELQGEIQ